MKKLTQDIILNKSSDLFFVKLLSRKLFGFMLILNLNFLMATEIHKQCSDYLSSSYSDELKTEVDARLSSIAESMGMKLGFIPGNKLKVLYFKILEVQDFEVLKLFLERTPSIVHDKNEVGESDLMYLSRSGWLEGFKLLINLENRDLDHYYRFKNALILAAEFGHTEIVSEILNSNKFVSGLKIYSRIDTALVEAAKNGHLNVIKIILDFLSSQTNPINFNSFLEQTLVYATENQQRDVVQYLLSDFDINVNARSGHNYQPVLSYAIKAKNREIIDLILSYKNIRLDIKLDNSSDYIRLAIENDDLETFTKIKNSISLDLNKQFKDSFTLLHLAAFANAARITKYIINDPEFKLINKEVSHQYKLHNHGNTWMLQTPLALAAMLGHDNVLIELLKHPDILVNVTSRNNISAFGVALESGHFNTVEILLRSGKLNLKLDLDRRQNELTSDFSRIVDTKNEDLIDLAISHDLNAAILLLHNPAVHPEASKSPLAKLITMNSVSKIKRLSWVKTIVEKIVLDPKIVDYQLSDSFQNSIELNFYEVLEILIRKFPDAKVTNNYLLIAVNSNSPESLKLLLNDKNIDINFFLHHDNGNTLLAVAIGKNYFDVGMILIQDPRIDLNMGFENQQKAPDGYVWMNGVFKSDNPNLDLVKYILSHYEIDIHMASATNENSLLIWSIEKNKVNFFDFIINSKLHNINFLAGRYLHSALMIAVKTNNTYFVSELLSHPDIDLNLKDSQGKTALNYAIDNQSIEVFEMLLEHPQMYLNKSESYEHFSNVMNTLIQQKKYQFIKLVVESHFFKMNTVNYFADNPNQRDILSKLSLTTEQLVLLDPLTALKNQFEDFNLIQDIDLIQSTLIELGFPENKAKFIYDKIRRRDVGLWFLEYISVEDYSQNAIDSIDILKKITNANFDPKYLRSMSEDTLGTLTEFLIEIHKYVKRDNRFWSKIHPDLYDKKNIKKLISFFGIFNSYYKTSHSGHITYVDKFLNLIEDIDLNPNNIVELTELTKQAMIKSVNKLLNTENFKFNIESYQKLLSEWGDLEPIWVLISRLSVQYPNEVEIIRTIFKHSLEDTFKNYKFSTKDKQLQMLSKDQLDTWIEPEAIVSIGRQSSSLAEQIQQSKEMLTNLLQTNLKPHWQDFYQSLNLRNTDVDLTPIEIQDLIIKLNESQENPKDIILKLSDSKPVLSLMIVKELIESFDLYSEDLELTKKIITSIKLFLLNIDIILNHSALNDSILNFSTSKDLASQVVNDLNDVIKKITSVFTEADGRSIIATVKNSDPKLLLTIGDVVCTSSCQNYKTGSVIRTLPGYVIDGNVQAIVSFDLKSSNFQRGDFYKLLSWVENKNEPYLVEFDGNLRQFTFTKNQMTIVSKPLEFAYLRNIIKVGVLDQTTRPALYMERAYEQSNPFLMQMRQQHHILFNQLAERLDAATRGSIRIIKSRNPEGQYSDASGGINQTDYLINTY